MFLRAGIISFESMFVEPPKMPLLEHDTPEMLRDAAKLICVHRMMDPFLQLAGIQTRG